MKAVVYLVCIAAAAAIQTALKVYGVSLGGAPVILLYAAALAAATTACKVYERKRAPAEKKPFPQPGKKLCGTPFVQAGQTPPGAQAQHPQEPAKKHGWTRLEIGLSIVCAVLVLVSAVLGYKVYEFRKLAITFIQVNDELLQENSALRAVESRAQTGEVLCNYVASIDSDKYHLPSCPCAENILPKNRIEINSALDLMVMENRGYTPCAVCLP